MAVHNPECGGSHCRDPKGEVRVMPLGGGANLILCRPCFEHENAYRRRRGRETDPEGWPVVDWETAKPYPEPEEPEGFDNQPRWGNSALKGYGTNSPAMMAARKQFQAGPGRLWDLFELTADGAVAEIQADRDNPAAADLSDADALALARKAADGGDGFAAKAVARHDADATEAAKIHAAIAKG